MFVLTKYKLFFAIGLLLFLVIASFQMTKTNTKQINDFKHFDTTSLHGIITDSVYTISSGTVVQINHEPFIFHPYASRLNNNTLFIAVAYPGDSLYKPAYHDTLRLVKKDKTFLYTFRIFNP